MPQQERKATQRVTLRTQNRLDVNRLEQPLESMYTSYVVPSSTATVSSGGQVTVKPPIPLAGQV